MYVPPTGNRGQEGIPRSLIIFGHGEVLHTYGNHLNRSKLCSDSGGMCSGDGHHESDEVYQEGLWTLQEGERLRRR